MEPKKSWRTRKVLARIIEVDKPYFRVGFAKETKRKTALMHWCDGRWPDPGESLKSITNEWVTLNCLMQLI